MRKALVIGINNYPGGAKLHGCIPDALAFKKLIERHEDGLRNFDVAFYTDVATKNDLTALVYEHFKGEHEVSVLYFSGHGAVNAIDGYLVTPDFEPFDPGLSLSHLMQLANESHHGNRVIILDCCHSGAAGVSAIMDRKASVLNSGVTILAASKPDESALEVDGGGIFTSLLLQAMEGGAADICGNVTPAGIYSYIDQALGALDQRPVFKTNITAFVPLRKVTPALPMAILHRLTTYFKDPMKALPLDPSYEFTNCDTIVPVLKPPYAQAEHVAVFKALQQMVSVGLVRPVGTPHMFFAAMDSLSCELTPLGRHYWRLVHENRI